jgi:hypothetical protein
MRRNGEHAYDICFAAAAEVYGVAVHVYQAEVPPFKAGPSQHYSADAEAFDVRVFAVSRDEEKVSYVCDRNVINILHYHTKAHFAVMFPMETAKAAPTELQKKLVMLDPGHTPGGKNLAPAKTFGECFNKSAFTLKTRMTPPAETETNRAAVFEKLRVDL